MKKLFILLILFIVMGCDMDLLINYKFDNFKFTEADFTKDIFMIVYKGANVYLDNRTTDQKLKNISLWVYLNIRYENDNNSTKDYWKTPEQTLANRSGDCEDTAILIIAIAYCQLKIKPSLILLEKADRTSGHAVAIYNDNVYEGGGSMNYVDYCNKYGYNWKKTILFDDIINTQCWVRMP